MSKLLYKITLPDGSPCYGGSGKWSLPVDGKPGAWRKAVGVLVPCENGLHVLMAEQVVHWLKWPAALWEVEVAGFRIDGSDKCVVRRARLVRRVEGYTERALLTFAEKCVDRAIAYARRSLPRFAKCYPDDHRPLAAIEAAEKARDGLRQFIEAINVRDAANAINAANAAARAAYATAPDTNAADAAARAINAANHRKAEREWQARRLAELIGIQR